MRRLTPALVAALFLVAVSNAFAEDSAELDRIKNAIAEAIAPGSDPGQPRVELAQPIGAVWRDGRAVVSLKGAKVVAPDEVTLLVGDVDIAVLPRGNGFYDFSVIMPKSFDIIGDNQQKDGRLTIGAYKFDGTWASEVEGLATVDAAFEDVHVEDLSATKENGDIKVGAIEARANYTKGSDGLWSGTANGRVADVKIHGGDGEDVSVASLEAKGVSNAWDWIGWNQVMTRIEKFAEAPAAQQTPDVRGQIAAALRALSWGSNNGTFTLKGLNVGMGGKRIFTLGDTTWSGALDGTKDVGPLSFRIAVTDLAVEENTLPANIAPTKGALDITLEQFPIRDLLSSIFMQVTETGTPAPVTTEPMTAPTEPSTTTEAAAGESAAQGSADNNQGSTVAENEAPPQEAPPAPPMIGPFPADDAFIQKVFELGSAVVLNEFSIDAPGAGVNANGRIKIDPESEAMGTGKLKATVRGLDALLAFANAEAKHDPDLQDFAAMLIFVKGLGKAEASTGGETIYVYDVDVPKQGAPTVNGTSLDQIGE